MTTAAPPCASGNLDACGSCGRVMHRGPDRACERGHPPHHAFGKCENCYTAAYKAARRSPTCRDRRLRAWADLAAIGVGFDEFPRHAGMTRPAWERAFQRARRAGHPLARRFDLET